MTTASLPVPPGFAPAPPAAEAVPTAHARARWEIPAYAGALLLTGILYVWNLAASGWANAFYSAAVQAGTQNWVAFFYGSSDAGNSITVDKPPASLWVMELSARVFGLSSWSILLPQALMGVGTAAIILFTVRKRLGAGAALLATGIFALTPVAALMFRFNNPDALLLLLLTASVALTLRAIDGGRLRWLLLAGVAVGFGFLTKQLQAFLVLPVLAGVYFGFAGAPLLKRLWHLLAALGAVIVSAGWWVAIVELVPASARPYIGGSQSNSFLELTFGYNGLGRITGNETGSVGGGNGWGETGLFRLFLNEIGGQISWLIPAALILFTGAMVLIGRAPRRDPRRILLVAFAGWLTVTLVAFSFMAGIFHAYYTVALAAPLAGLLGASAVVVFRHRDRLWTRILLAATAVITAGWAWVLLERSSSWMPWLKVVVAVVSVAGAVLVMLPSRSRALTTSAAAALIVGGLLAPAAYTLQTVGTGHSGSIVTAGPSVQGVMGGRPGGGFGGDGAPGGQGGPGGTQGGMPGGGSVPGGNGTGQNGGFPGQNGGFPGQNGTGQDGGTPPTIPGGFEGGMRGGGAGGLLEASKVDSALRALLEQDASDYTWVAATVGSQSAAGYQLATGDAVMPIGGFNGSDPSPMLEQFQQYVDEGRIHFFIAGGGMGMGGDSDIQSWVEANFTAQTVGGVTVYDLTAATTGR
ncbi:MULTISPECIES: glycosyltransferase family 39 protein [unclassified Microbacterium]|uniref:ArnT family glycosyltransferase n=1 Tax=unclassified Microbacterium TaxID=2609290 RepID=UPI0012F7CDB8|nr:glycosyltransferase family 39 protein [Microbacterium sp. MAH-37]MVQ42863.1 glycosyl transferase [Microbacterium sp. MAH-37]